MTFNELAKNRFSVRSFSDKPIEEEKLNLILEAGRSAPTAKNLQPERIYVLKSPEAIEKINDIYYVWGSKTVLIICADKDEAWKNPYSGHNSYEMDATICATHIMLSAYELGIGSTWVCCFDPAKVKDAFSLPNNIVPLALIPLGYPSIDASPSARHCDRKPISDITRFL